MSEIRKKYTEKEIGEEWIKLVSECHNNEINNSGYCMDFINRIKDLFHGVNCTILNSGIVNEGYQPSSLVDDKNTIVDMSLTKIPSLNNGNNIETISADIKINSFPNMESNITISNLLVNPISSYSTASLREPSVFYFHMREKTELGYYFLHLKGKVVLTKGLKMGVEFESEGSKLGFFPYTADSNYKVQDLLPPIINCKPERSLFLCNKIFKFYGLADVSMLVKNGWDFKITDEEWERYTTAKINQELGEMHAKANVESTIQDLEKIDEENFTDYRNVPTIDKANQKAIVEKLLDLQELGVTLDDKQLALIDYYKKTNSDKFRQYQADREKRNQGQKSAMERIAQANKEKEEWQNSKENPTNIREEELSKIRKQIDLLNEINKMDMSLLSEEQKRMLETNSLFIEMLDKSRGKVNEEIDGLYLDTGMNLEIRQWYNTQYSEENSKAKSR